MATPRELSKEVTAGASAESYLLGYNMQAYLLNPFEDTVRIKQGGHYAYRIYDELLRDARVSGVFRKRVKETTSKPWEVEPATGSSLDKKAARIVQAQLEHIGFDSYQRRKMTALIKGLSVGEIMWRDPTSARERKMLGTVIADRIDFRKPWHFRFSRPEGEGLHLHYVGYAGIIGSHSVDLTKEHPRKFISYTWGSDYSDPYGKGLGHQLYWPVVFKKEDWRFWLYFNDKYGMPTLDVSYTSEGGDVPGISPESEEGKAEIAAAKAAGTKIRQMGVLVHSDKFTYSLLEAQNRGDIKTYKDLIDYCDTEITIAVTGATLSVDMKGDGARAATETHQGDLEILGEDDAEDVCDHDTETLVRYISELNVPGATPPAVKRVFPDRTNFESLSRTHVAVMTAVNAGLDVDFAEKTYNVEIDRDRLSTKEEAVSTEEPVETEDTKEEDAPTEKASTNGVAP